METSYKLKPPKEFEYEKEYPANVILYEKPNLKGIVMKTGNRFFKRLWYFLSNPFRYIFTGKIFY